MCVFLPGSQGLSLHFISCVPNMAAAPRAFCTEYYLYNSDWMKLLGLLNSGERPPPPPPKKVGTGIICGGKGRGGGEKSANP